MFGKLLCQADRRLPIADDAAGLRTETVTTSYCRLIASADGE